MRCVEQHGIERTSVAMIAAEAGVSRPTLYAYFENHDEIVTQAAIAATESFVGRVVAHVRRFDTAAERLVEATLFSVRGIRREPALAMRFRAGGLLSGPLTSDELHYANVCLAPVVELAPELEPWIDEAAEVSARVVISLLSRDPVHPRTEAQERESCTAGCPPRSGWCPSASARRARSTGHGDDRPAAPARSGGGPALGRGGRRPGGGPRGGPRATSATPSSWTAATTGTCSRSHPGAWPAFYALPEDRASKGVADWRMLRRKFPDEVFVGRRTLAPPALRPGRRGDLPRQRRPGPGGRPSTSWAPRARSTCSPSPAGWGTASAWPRGAAPAPRAAPASSSSSPRFDTLDAADPSCTPTPWPRWRRAARRPSARALAVVEELSGRGSPSCPGPRPSTRYSPGSSPRGPTRPPASAPPGWPST